MVRGDVIPRATGDQRVADTLGSIETEPHAHCAYEDGNARVRTAGGLGRPRSAHAENDNAHPRTPLRSVDAEPSLRAVAALALVPERQVHHFAHDVRTETSAKSGTRACISRVCWTTSCSMTRLTRATTCGVIAGGLATNTSSCA